MRNLLLYVAYTVAMLLALVLTLVLKAWLTFALILVVGGAGWVYTTLALRIVKQEEVWVIELLGQFYALWGPGFHFLWPWLMRVRWAWDARERWIALYDEMEDAIDFLDGSARPVEAKVFLRMLSPFTPYPQDPADPDGPRFASGAWQATYGIQNFREAVKAVIETALTRRLNGMTIDKGISNRGKHDFLKLLTKLERQEIQAKLRAWGHEVTKVTIDDFSLSEELKAFRSLVLQTQREASAAEFGARKFAWETMGTFVHMVAASTGKTPDEVTRTIAANSELRQAMAEMSQRLLELKLKLDANALRQFIFQGMEEGGGLQQTLLAAASLLSEHLSERG